MRSRTYDCDTFNIGGVHYDAHFVLETLSPGEYRVVRAKATNVETGETFDIDDFDMPAEPEVAEHLACAMLKQAFETAIERKS